MLTSIKRIAVIVTALLALVIAPAHAETTITFAGYTGLYHQCSKRLAHHPVNKRTMMLARAIMVMLAKSNPGMVCALWL